MSFLKFQSSNYSFKQTLHRGQNKIQRNNVNSTRTVCLFQQLDDVERTAVDAISRNGVCREQIKLDWSELLSTHIWFLNSRSRREEYVGRQDKVS